MLLLDEEAKGKPYGRSSQREEDSTSTFAIGKSLFVVELSLWSRQELAPPPSKLLENIFGSDEEVR